MVVSVFTATLVENSISQWAILVGPYLVFLKYLDIGAAGESVSHRNPSSSY